VMRCVRELCKKKYRPSVWNELAVMISGGEAFSSRKKK
jgi:hypothetical protein